MFYKVSAERHDVVRRFGCVSVCKHMYTYMGLD